MRTFVMIAVVSMLIAACGSSQTTEDEKPVEETAASEQALEGEAGAAEATEPTEGEGDAPSEEPASMPETAPEDILANDGTRQVGDVTKCPVSGHVFTIAEDSPKVEHDGGTYYLCCPNCVEKFKSDPEKYAAAGKAGESVGKAHEKHKHGDHKHHDH